MVFRKEGAYYGHPTEDETMMVARIDQLFDSYPFPSFKNWGIILGGYPHRNDVNFSWHDQWCNEWVYGYDFDEFLGNIAAYIDRVHRSYRMR